MVSSKTELRAVALASLYSGEKPERFAQAIKSAVFQSTKIPIALVVDGPLPLELETELNKQIDNINHLFRLDKNSGLAEALQFALLNLVDHYDYVIRFDTDDVNVQERFNLLLKHISIGGYDLIGSNIEEFCGDNPNVTLGFREVPLDARSIERRVHWRNPFNHPSVAFNIRAVLSVGGYVNMPFFEDWYLWAKMLKAGYVVGNLDTPLVRFRGGQGALSRRRGGAYARHEINFYRALYLINLPRRWLIFFALPLRLCSRFLSLSLFHSLYYFSRRFDEVFRR